MKTQPIRTLSKNRSLYSVKPYKVDFTRNRQNSLEIDYLDNNPMS